MGQPTQKHKCTGVVLDAIEYNSRKRTLSIEIQALENVDYFTRLIGTRSDYNSKDSDGETGIGQVLAEFSGTSIVFEIPDDVLYVRATITSSRPHPNASFEGQMEEAWTQPVAWR